MNCLKVEEVFMQRDLQKRVLQTQLHEHFQFYEKFNSDTKLNNKELLSFKGKQKNENWTKFSGLKYKLKALKKMLTSQYSVQLKEVLDDCTVVPYSTLVLHLSEETSISVHAVSTYRDSERFDSVLLKDSVQANFPSPWVCVRQFFMLEMKDITCTHWALIQPFEFADTYPLHVFTGAPYVKFSTNESTECMIIPAEYILQPVHVIPNEEEEDTFWINWWLSFGELPYPEEHRWAKQQEWKWRPKVA